MPEWRDSDDEDPDPTTRRGMITLLVLVAIAFMPFVVYILFGD